MVQIAAARVNETAVFDEDSKLVDVQSSEMTAGWGVDRMFVDVAAIKAPGLAWVMVVAIAQSLLLERIQELQVGGTQPFVVVVFFVLRSLLLLRYRWCSDTPAAPPFPCFFLFDHRTSLSSLAAG